MNGMALFWLASKSPRVLPSVHGRLKLVLVDNLQDVLKLGQAFGAKALMALKIAFQLAVLQKRLDVSSLAVADDKETVATGSCS